MPGEVLHVLQSSDTLHFKIGCPASGTPATIAVAALPGLSRWCRRRSQRLGQSYYKQLKRYEHVRLGETRGLALIGWGRIFELYEVLLPVEPYAVVELVRAAAMAMWDGPFAGMESIDAKGSFPKKGGATRHR